MVLLMISIRNPLRTYYLLVNDKLWGCPGFTSPSLWSHFIRALQAEQSSIASTLTLTPSALTTTLTAITTLTALSALSALITLITLIALVVIIGPRENHRERVIIMLAAAEVHAPLAAADGFETRSARVPAARTIVAQPMEAAAAVLYSPVYAVVIPGARALQARS